MNKKTKNTQTKQLAYLALPTVLGDELWEKVVGNPSTIEIQVFGDETPETLQVSVNKKPTNLIKLSGKPSATIGRLVDEVIQFNYHARNTAQ